MKEIICIYAHVYTSFPPVRKQMYQCRMVDTPNETFAMSNTLPHVSLSPFSFSQLDNYPTYVSNFAWYKRKMEIVMAPTMYVIPSAFFKSKVPVFVMAQFTHLAIPTQKREEIKLTQTHTGTCTR